MISRCEKCLGEAWDALWTSITMTRASSSRLSSELLPSCEKGRERSIMSAFCGSSSFPPVQKPLRPGNFVSCPCPTSHLLSRSSHHHCRGFLSFVCLCLRLRGGLSMAVLVWPKQVPSKQWQPALPRPELKRSEDRAKHGPPLRSQVTQEPGPWHGHVLDGCFATTCFL